MLLHILHYFSAQSIFLLRPLSYCDTRFCIYFLSKKISSYPFSYSQRRLFLHQSLDSDHKKISLGVEGVIKMKMDGSQIGTARGMIKSFRIKRLKCSRPLSCKRQVILFAQVFCFVSLSVNLCCINIFCAQKSYHIDNGIHDFNINFKLTEHTTNFVENYNSPNRCTRSQNKNVHILVTLYQSK